MGIVKEEEVIAWRDGNQIICNGCVDPGETTPLTEDDIEDTDIVTCDNCGGRIQ